MLIKCPICERPVDSNAPICPHCGATKKARDNEFMMGIWGMILIFGLMMCSHIEESYNTIDRQENVWCGYYNDEGQIKIYEDDIAQKGSSICLKDTSMKKDVMINVEFPKHINKDKYNSEYKQNIVIIRGNIENNTLKARSIQKYKR